MLHCCLPLPLRELLKVVYLSGHPLRDVQELVGPSSPSSYLPLTLYNPNPRCRQNGRGLHHSPSQNKTDAITTLLAKRRQKNWSQRGLNSRPSHLHDTVHPGRRGVLVRRSNQLSYGTDGTWRSWSGLWIGAGPLRRMNESCCAWLTVPQYLDMD
ncbi:hypothetical protein GE09DRAFT_186989 [Coniochaeta sp. 2T2.1]|nr:hypothetical protein GE09DRAFT_186989 [Coniochaeta sp. 2T2.1]